MHTVSPVNEDGQYLAKIFIAARLESGLTQTELARKGGMTQTTIARLESGWDNPTWRTMCRVADALSKRIVLVDK